MRRQSKEINIFSMSVVDLFASALGAFILISIVLFPSAFKTTRESRQFLAVAISWTNSDDIDLYVEDPRGNVFSYKQTSVPGSEAGFEEDTRQGPGNELWIHPAVKEGRYRIYYHLFRMRGNGGGNVRGKVIYRGGRKRLNNVPIRSGALRGTCCGSRTQPTLVATIDVDRDGKVTVR